MKNFIKYLKSTIFIIIWFILAFYFNVFNVTLYFIASKEHFDYFTVEAIGFICYILFFLCTILYCFIKERNTRTKLKRIFVIILVSLFGFAKDMLMPDLNDKAFIELMVLTKNKPHDNIYLNFTSIDYNKIIIRKGRKGEEYENTYNIIIKRIEEDKSCTYKEKQLTEMTVKIEYEC